MINEANRPIAVRVALDLFPERLRRALLEDGGFAEAIGISLSTTVTLVGVGVGFRREVLFDALRSAIRTPASEIVIPDLNGNIWNVMAAPADGYLIFTMSGLNKRHELTDHTALAEDREIRIRWFTLAATEAGLVGGVFEKWLDVFANAPLTDEQFVALMSDISFSPENAQRAIAADLEQGTINLTSLVPTDTRYYHLLVGPADGHVTANQFIASVAGPKVSDLQSSSSQAAWRHATLTCNAALVTRHLQASFPFPTNRSDPLETLISNRDPFSRLTAVEVLLPLIEKAPELAVHIETIARSLLSDTGIDADSDYQLLSEFFILTYAELSRRHLLGHVRPFYRRHCALAHASLCVRAAKEANVDQAKLCEALHQQSHERHGTHYYLQALIDLRAEPRWQPDYASGEQLRAECIGRLLQAISQCDSASWPETLRALLIGRESPLEQSAAWPTPFLPGPLEGEVLPEREIPAELMEKAAESLASEELDVLSFAISINTALLLPTNTEQAALAAKALRRVQFAVGTSEDDSSTMNLVSGLSILAAVSRSSDLCEAVRTLLRVLRRRNRTKFEVWANLATALNASAAYGTSEEWASCLGEWITEIAFEIFDESSAVMLRSSLKRLIALEPSLARHCAQADAALASVL